MIRYVDIPSIMQVIGGVFIDNSLLDNDKYVFSEDDFTEEFHKILFGSIYNIHLLGGEKIDIPSIEHYIEQRPKAYGIYNANKGREYLQRLAEITQLSTFDYYYQRMKKMTLFRSYQKIGMDVSWLYNPDDVLNVKKKQSQEDWLDNTSLEEIADLINDRIEDIRQKYAECGADNTVQAGTDIDNFLEDLKKNPEYGYPLYGPLINTITRGARLKKVYLRSAVTGLGKALDNETVLPTPRGFCQVKDIKIGDKLFGADGKPTTVIGVFPQPEPKQVYIVRLADGREIRCCEDHLWQVKTLKRGVAPWIIKTTKEIFEEEQVSDTPFCFIDTKGYTRPKWGVPQNKPVEYEYRELNRDIKDYAQEAYEFNMMIPEEIMFNTSEIRFEFAREYLRGRKHLVYLEENSYWCYVSFFRGLGYTVHTSEIYDEEEERFVYVLKIPGNASKVYCAIQKIIKTNEYAEMTCFTVDNKDSLFLCGDHVVTHNTRMMIADACNFACKKIYDKEKRSWQEKDYQVPTLFIATEQDIREIQTMLVAFVADVDEEHILTGQYEDEEWDRVKEAADIIKNAPLYVEELPDFSMQDIEKIIKRNIREHQIKMVAFDYLHSSMKILSEVSGKAGVKGLREDNVLFMISVRLKDLANQYNVFIITSTQLNSQYLDGKLDQNSLRGSKAVADKVDFASILVKATKQDLEYLQSIMEMGFPAPDIKMSIYKNRRGRYKDVILWCRSRRESCRIIPMFMTDSNYEWIDIKDTDIKIKSDENV